MGNLMKWYQMIAAQPHKATANGGSILIAEPKIERLAVTFAPVQNGSGTPSPSNVRPISGWTGLSVQMAGANLINDTLRYVANDETVYIGATDSECHTFLKAGKYIISCNFDEPYAMYWMYWQNDSANTRLWLPRTGQHSLTFTTDTDRLYKFWVYRSSTNGGVDTAKIKSVTLTTASTIIDYPITWANEVDTVYGGTVDLISGVLTVDRAMATYDGSEAWYSYTTPNQPNQTFYTASLTGKKIGRFTSISNEFENIKECWGGNGVDKYGVYSDHTSLERAYFRFPNAEVDTLDKFKAWLAVNPLQLCYELDTPHTYQLTPQAINALRGMQTVSSSAGSVEITYWTH